jgi:hypothetical protein
MESPCVNCIRVKDPVNCENKLCKDWQAWFIDRWETMRETVRAEMERDPLVEFGVPLGGEKYASPHRVHTYLDTDPCSQCLYPKDHCHAPCPGKQVWIDRKRGVHK